MQPVTLAIFFATVLPLVFTPGPDVIYITTRGIAQGRRAALLSTLGVCAGYVMHTILAILGLTALLHASETLFNVVKYAGAAYLVYLGIKALTSKSSVHFQSDRKQLSPTNILLTGMATSVMNPKGILLFLAYFPQFVTPEAGSATLQLTLIGALFTVMCGTVYGMYGLCSGAIGERLASEPRITRLLNWLTGTVFIGLGIRLALPEKR